MGQFRPKCGNSDQDQIAKVMMHRLREAMTDVYAGPMSGDGGVIEADETYYGNSSKRAKYYKKGHSHKSGTVGLVDPATGHAGAFAVKSRRRKLFAKSFSPMFRAKLL